MTTIAWVNDEDIKAVRTDDGDHLLVDGFHIPLSDRDNSPVQQIINYCHCNKRQKRTLRALWLQRLHGED